MGISNFIYRQKQKWNYHLSDNDIGKQIAEINRFGELIKSRDNVYIVKELDLSIPKNKYDYVFFRYDLLIQNSHRLNGKYHIKEDRLMFSWDNFNVNICNAGDLFLINEIFVEKCYQFKLPPNRKVKVIDIGLNVGIASLYFASLPYVEEIYGFEPFKPTFDLAVKNLSINTELASKIKIENFGLGNREKIEKIPYNMDNPGLNKSNFKDDGMEKLNIKEMVTIKTAINEIDHILDKNPNKNFIIKIDTEGAEYEIIDSIFSKKLNERIIGFMIEWHNEGPVQIENCLLNTNFKLFSFTISRDTGMVYAFR